MSALLCWCMTLLIPAQAQDVLSVGCVRLNDNSGQAPISVNPSSSLSGGVGWGSFYFEAGEVISASMQSGLAGTLGFGISGTSTLSDLATLPAAVVIIIPVSGVYSIDATFNVSNPTANQILATITTACSRPQAGSSVSDGRLIDLPNSAVYANEQGIFVYSANGQSGFLSAVIGADELAGYPEQPEENTLLASSLDGYIHIYLLTTGEYQINIGPDAEGKVIVIIFTGLPPTNVYRRDFNVNDILNPE